MNTLFLLLFITILILTLSSVNFIFLNDSFAIMIQDDNNEISLASTNDTFTESEPRIPPSALEEKDTSIIPNIETSQEAQTLQSNRSFIENIIKSEIRGENKSSIIATTNNNSALSQFYQLRNNYLSQWESLSFQPKVDIFIKENSTQVKGYGIYTERNSNIFNSDERISVYLEPIGFKHQPIMNSKGNKLYLTNITTIITMEDDKGNEVPSVEDIKNYDFISHNKITELFLPIDTDLISPLPSGNYTITYTIIDEISKEDFDIQKNIIIS